MRNVPIQHHLAPSKATKILTGGINSKMRSIHLYGFFRFAKCHKVKPSLGRPQRGCSRDTSLQDLYFYLLCMKRAVLGSSVSNVRDGSWYRKLCNVMCMITSNELGNLLKGTCIKHECSAMQFICMFLILRM